MSGIPVKKGYTLDTYMAKIAEVLEIKVENFTLTETRAIRVSYQLGDPYTRIAYSLKNFRKKTA